VGITGDGPLGDALKDCAAAKFSGILRVDGQPGGSIYLSGGGIAACETPGAPNLEVILLRSGRIAEPDWDAAFAASAKAGRRMSAELVTRGLIGAGELEALLRISLADAIFALVDGVVDGRQTEERTEDSLLPLAPGARAGWLLAEATRRKQVLASFPDPAVSARDRVAAVPGKARPGVAFGDGRDEILALADGRRTARDLAFALGRGLYATMLQLARMRSDNLVVIVSPSAPPDEEPSPRPGRADDGATRPGLPHRRKDRPREATRRNLPSSPQPPAIQLVRPRSPEESKQ